MTSDGIKTAPKAQRTKARVLALVNWRGVFFMQYGLDRHVTALEGANGAGKTTVMIAAYVVLLPDMSRLRFTNLGESGATGGDRGIWGRLGEPGRPSYAVMDLELADGARMLAGVMLERRSEPTVEPTPFVVHDLPAGVGLHEVLLDRRGEVEHVPELDVVRRQVQAAGGKLRTFSTAKDYFAELFDRGVLPLRMQADEERGKLNEMLRTSMVGGISRALTGGMREFLLREESGLAEVLRRMRGNLEACRRTRREVEEARRLEGEIHAVWEAGQSMFGAVVHAARGEAEERREALAAAKARAEASRAARDEATSELEVTRGRCEELGRARASLKGRIQESRERLERARRAREVGRRLARLADERSERGVERDRREEADRVAQAERARARAAWDRAREAFAAASRGVADLKAGYEELERRAAQHRLARERLAELVAAPSAHPADGEDLRAARFAAVEQRVAARLAEIDEELVRADRTIASGALARSEYEAVRAALGELVEHVGGAPVAPGQAHARARAVLAELRAAEAEGRQLQELERRLAALETAAQRQREVRERARVLGGLSTAKDVERALAESEQAHAHASEGAATAERSAAEAAREGREVARALSALEPVAARTDALRARLAELAERLGEAEAPASASALMKLRRRLEGRRQELAAERAGADAEVARHARAVAQLSETGAPGGDAERAGLMAVRDAVEGELFASRFEELAVELAPVAEAALGPLCDAIAVADPVASAKRAARLGARPDEIWFVGPRAALPLDDDGTPYAEVVEDAVLLEQNGIVRLTRLPAAPRLGRSARVRRAAELEAARASLEATRERLREDERRLAGELAFIDELVPDAGLLDFNGRPDPRTEVTALEERALAADLAQRAAQAARERAQRELTVLGRRRAELRGLLAEAHHLDLSDQAAEARALAERVAVLRAGRARLKATDKARRVVEEGLDALRLVPPGEQELAGLAERRAASVRARDHLQRVRDRLRWLADHQDALAWTDAEAALSAKAQVGPALEAQLRQADDALRAAEAAVEQAEARARDTAEAAARAGGALIACEQQIAAAEAELAGQVAADARPDEEEGALAGLEREAETVEQAEREARAQLVRGEERLRQLDERARDDAWRAAEEERALSPTQARWARLRADAGARGVLAAAFSERAEREVAGLTAKELWLKARQRVSVLIERIGRAVDGADVASGLSLHLQAVGELGGASGDATEAGHDASAGDVTAWLRQWLTVRDWLRRRVPPQIAEVDDPLEALARLREHLARLEERLATQEEGLRGQSGDVARNLDAQIRRARNQVTRLNTDLEGVSFGAIEGMLIRARPAQRTDAVLRALREGAAQQLLFEPNLPIEEAMDELFKRYGGGRTGGDKLLDYREYLDLQVEIRRRGKSTWEIASPTRLSTGEAIGVGAAVMMATLKAWESEASLLRPRHLAGTLRLLFLDEATRLSQDNLAILFELCERLELQLLIAAPEVARAEGNTTYRLVRALDDNGREEVRVSGRRVMANAEAEALMARRAEA